MPPYNMSDSEIISHCSDPERQIVGGERFGNLVIKITDEVVVKFGVGVTCEEAENQQEAFELLQKTGIRVPRLYRFFEECRPYSTRGYIVMEYIHGKCLEPAETTDEVAHILSIFSSIHGKTPGPFRKGISHGIIWSESGKPEFSTIQEMESWLNCRFLKGDSKLAFSHLPLVMCHLDLAPRNILRLPDNSLCLVDWATAGFYPRFFEVCILKLNSGLNGKFEESLLDRIECLTDEEDTQLQSLIRSVYNSNRYRFQMKMS